ncbi:hypothetical protein ACFVUS_16660 [Nocardia sp. NPDC058058]|uniref:DUF7373 family lipoprotein n=1 Tax=Nocardia sp. NPDC058058 TaxID=3346317 RepID=UPI0036DDB0A6
MVYVHRIFRKTVLALAAVLGLAGCGSVVPGIPVAGEVDVRELDVGSYSTDPLNYRALSLSKTEFGAELAITRLSGFVATGTEIDPRLRNELAGKAIRTSRDVDDRLAPIVERNGMMFGFGVGAAAESATTWVRLTVLQFPEPAAARTAAIEVEAAGFSAAPKANAPVTLDWYPDAKAHWRQDIPSLDAALARGNYLIIANIARPEPNLAALQDLGKKAIAAQLPLLDQLPSLSVPQMRALDHDPQDMLRRTLHPKADFTPSFDREAVFNARGFRHVAPAPELWRRLLEVGGIDAVARVSEGGLVVRARDPKAATVVLNDLRTAAGQTTAAPAGVPDAFCVENQSATPRFSCTVRSGRYVAQVGSAQLQDAHQRAAAQFAILVNSGWM